MQSNAITARNLVMVAPWPNDMSASLLSQRDGPEWEFKKLTPDGGEAAGVNLCRTLGMGTGRPASHLKYVGLGALQAWTQFCVTMSAFGGKADMTFCAAHVCF